MLIFSELETGTLDLRLDFYGYEDCLPDQFFGPAIRENYVLHYITEGKGCLEYKDQKIPLQWTAPQKLDRKNLIFEVFLLWN